MYVYLGTEYPGINILHIPQYRGFKRKGARLLGHNIIVVANQRYGLKRCSGMLGSILDLNVGSLQ
jgi:hypothetical protein